MIDQIQLRLEEVLLLIPCPVAGCWGTHGAKTAYHHDERRNRHVLDVWPKFFEEPSGDDEDIESQSDDEILFGLAEFDFRALIKTVSLETFHFSQLRAILEIGWMESGEHLELRVHLVPEELDED